MILNALALHTSPTFRLPFEFSTMKYCLAGNYKPGALATDFIQKVFTSMCLMLHAPITHYSGGEWKIIPLSPLPDDKDWSDMTGFDPMEHFSPVSVEDEYIEGLGEVR